jgi:hypothetical protein
MASIPGIRLTVKVERSGLLTHIATTESVSLCVGMKKLTAFVELESVIKSSKGRKKSLELFHAFH